MTNRERMLNLLHYKPVDRLPAIHFGYWDELLIEWAEQGYISMDMAKERIASGDASDVDGQLDKMLGWDDCWSKGYGMQNSLMPMFEKKVLETYPDGTQRVQSPWGLIERVKPGVSSIPSEDDYQLKDRQVFEELYKPKMQFSLDRALVDFYKDFNDNRPQDRFTSLQVGSVLGDIRNMLSVVGMSEVMYHEEDEELFADIIDTYADMQYKCVEAVLATGARFDCGHYWEDICFKNGPLLSPVMFEELCAKHYKKRNDLLHKHGIDIISLDCDGVTEKLLQTWFENGVNVMFPIEVGVWGDQFEAARKKYGDGMLGIGGMDKTALRKDRAAVDMEIERMKRLADFGGFVPCPDHRLMPGTKFELVQYYTDEIKKIRL